MGRAVREARPYRRTIPDLTGKTIGHWFVLEEVEHPKERHYKVKCACGTESAVRASRLLKNESLGCRKCRASNVSHRLSRTKEYQAWKGMRRRCLDSKHPRYKDYGGRGIKICPQWIDNPVKFIEDMGPMPKSDMSLDRKDVDGDYSPDNCRWATFIQQMRNRKDTTYVNYNGEKVSLRDLHEKSSLPFNIVYSRIVKLGWDIDRALSVPKGSKKDG